MRIKRRFMEQFFSYLEIKKNNFYSVVSDLDGKRFVTARGWEDLSQVMKVYEQLGFAIDYDFVVQYLQDEEIARDFAAYYELYNKYKKYLPYTGNFRGQHTGKQYDDQKCTV